MKDECRNGGPPPPAGHAKHGGHPPRLATLHPVALGLRARRDAPARNRVGQRRPTLQNKSGNQPPPAGAAWARGKVRTWERTRPAPPRPWSLTPAPCVLNPAPCAPHAPATPFVASSLRRFVATTALLLAVALAFATGCAQRRPRLVRVFPHNSAAWPWLLRQNIWEGSIDQAASALGRDAEIWQKLQPDHVWLAVYDHATRDDTQLVVRVFRFPTADDARAAYDAVRPPHAEAFDIGDAGCWTSDGVLFVWGRLVFDVLIRSERGEVDPEQTIAVVSFLEHRMPPGLPADPR